MFLPPDVLEWAALKVGEIDVMVVSDGVLSLPGAPHTSASDPKRALAHVRFGSKA
jgi:hypothetical protein